jgi:hypothetical protein
MKNQNIIDVLQTYDFNEQQFQIPQIYHQIQEIFSVKMRVNLFFIPHLLGMVKMHSIFKRLLVFCRELFTKK